jgi:DNA-binding NtrC family response regulator
MACILIVDDDQAILDSCRTILADEGHTVEVASGGAAALELLRQKSFQLALVDLRMPGVNGLEVVEQASAIDPDLVVIVFTAFGTIESAVQAVRNGAVNYVTKPFTAGELVATIDKGLEHSRVVRETWRQHKELKECCPLHRIIGRSSSLEMILGTVAKVAPSDANVLITGESGTGKELIARALHANSLRAKRPFVPVDCAAMPAALLESELFGHEKGAFTGAHQVKRGLMEAADGGTLFLDEIGEMPIELQAKLLRALQERTFRRLGGERLQRTDLRVICSTNRHLETEVREGRFRRDLFYRLNVVSLSLPPLRDRAGDVALLSDHFAQQFSSAARKNCRRVSADALRLLEAHHWPGNIRELRNVIERAVVLCEGDTLAREDLPDYLAEHARLGQQIQAEMGYKAARERWLESQGSTYLVDLLKRHNGNISAVAREAQISRKSVYELLRRFGVEPRSVTAPPPERL